MFTFWIFHYERRVRSLAFGLSLTKWRWVSFAFVFAGSLAVRSDGPASFADTGRPDRPDRHDVI